MNILITPAGSGAKGIFMNVKIIEIKRFTEIAVEGDFREIERIIHEEGIELKGLKHFFLYNEEELGYGMVMYEASTHLSGCGVVCPAMTISDKITGPKRLEEMLERYFLHLSEEAQYTIITHLGRSGNIKEVIEGMGYDVDVISPKKD